VAKSARGLQIFISELYVLENIIRALSWSLASVFHHFTRKLLLQFAGLKMRKLHCIDFLVTHSTILIDSVANVEIPCWWMYDLFVLAIPNRYWLLPWLKRFCVHHNQQLLLLFAIWRPSLVSLYPLCTSGVPRMICSTLFIACISHGKLWPCSPPRWATLQVNAITKSSVQMTKMSYENYLSLTSKRNLSLPSTTC